MEAFLVLQKQVYQLAALAKTGVADVGQLSDVDRRELEISVVVTDGSSNYLADLTVTLKNVLNRMVGKMNGKQAVIVIISLGVLVAAPWSFTAWLDQQKTIKLEEIKSKDHIAALQAIGFATEQHSQTYRQIIQVLEKQGDIGKRAIEAAQQTNEALLKAASQTPKSEINDVEITRREAEVLRVPAPFDATKTCVEFGS